MLAAPPSWGWHRGPQAVTCYLFCMACKAKDGFYSFKWFKKIHNMWKVYEIQISVSISRILLEHSHTQGNRQQAGDSSSLALDRKSLQPPALGKTTHILTAWRMFKLCWNLELSQEVPLPLDGGLGNDWAWIIHDEFFITPLPFHLKRIIITVLLRMEFW